MAMNSGTSLIKTAFTLIELLVVIAIIVILAAMVLPVLTRAKQQAQSAACKNHLHQMGLALWLYVNDNNQNYPYASVLETVPGGDSSGWLDFWELDLQPYYPISWTNSAYHCAGYKGAIKLVNPILGHPIGSYAYNGFGTGPTAELGLGGWATELLGQGPDIRLVSASKVASPSDMFAIGESRVLRYTVPSAWVSELTGTIWVGWDIMIPGLNFDGVGIPAYPERHGRNYNQLFCDGHVEGIPRAILFNLTNTAVRWNNDHQPHPETWQGP